MRIGAAKLLEYGKTSASTQGPRAARACLGELVAARSGDLRAYGTGGTAIVRDVDGSRTMSADGESFTIADQDSDVRSLRSNVVLRWEWRPGSTAFLGWQQNGYDERAREAVRPRDLFDAFQGGADHFLAIKVSYWLPVR